MENIINFIWEYLNQTLTGVENINLDMSKPVIISYQEVKVPNITSCDSTCNETNQFAPGQSVYINSSGLESDTTYRIWIQRNPVIEGQVLNVSEDPSGIHELITTDENGTFGPTKIWDIPSYATPTFDTFDIVADKQSDGDNTGYYNADSDAIDLFEEVGFVAPVPEPGTLTMFSMGMIMLLGYIGYRKR